jgi:hypothetical protein
MHLQLRLRSLLMTLFSVVLLTPALATAPSPLSPPSQVNAHDTSDHHLSFDVAEGHNLNSFLRDGPVAAHLLLRSGTDPRILVAFPAGNSGVGLWFLHGAAVTWELTRPPQPRIAKDTHGRPLYGMTAEARLIGTQDLSFKRAVLSSVRVLRDYQALGTFPAAVATNPTIEGQTITWARDRIDGAAGYRLSIQITKGTLRADHVVPASDGSIGVKITAMSGEAPMTPLSGTDLLNSLAKPDAAARNALTFLSYREKFTAGSWRFNTYFGRDTLMSVRLLMPVLTPQAVQAGLGAVLTRVSPEGEVAHEEDIGEFAILDHLAAGVKSDAPTFNYNMIDGSFMLTPVAAQWLLDDYRGRSQARHFLARTDGRRGEPVRTFGADLVRNLKFVLQAAAGFAADPRAQNLVALKPGLDAGQWRDSNTGLGGGRFPYDVNAVFVPAALEAAQRFFSSGLLDPYLQGDERAIFSRAGSMAATWRADAAPLFEVSVPNAAARGDISRYAAAIKVSDEAALRSIDDAAVTFHALSLDADGKSIPIVHSDEGFEMLFGRPSPAQLSQAVNSLMRPFPAGLLTGVGIVVANPVYAGPTVQSQLNSSAYHGTVIWSWQQAVLAAGFDRQIKRRDLPADARALLRSAQRQLWNAIRSAHAMRNSELWSWTFAQNHFHVAAFGANAADADESNAAQLWSTVYLAIPDPYPARVAN